MTMLAACQAAAPLPSVTATRGVEFTLAPDQTAAVTDTGLVIKFISISSDERCPSEIECAMSGPVTVSLSVQQGNETAADIILQTFTDNNGRAPGGQFEGIEDRVVYEGYWIQVMGVTPYPANPSKPIKSDEYRVILTVTQN